MQCVTFNSPLITVNNVVSTVQHCSEVPHNVQCIWMSQKAVEVGKRREEDRGRIQEEEDRGETAARKEDTRVKEAEEELHIENTRYEG